MRVRVLIALALVGVLAGCQESGFDESKETQRPLKVQDAMNPLTGTKVPSPLLIVTDILLYIWLAVTISGLLSLLKSPTATPQDRKSVV